MSVPEAQPWSPRLTNWAVGLGAAAVAAARWATRARVADDYDSMNFLLGMSHYDLASYQPQFPGYPVYVGLGAALHRLGLVPLTAATAISALAAGGTTLGMAALARRLGGPRAAVAAVALQAVAWLPWLIGSGALSESLGVCLATASFALLLGGEPPHPFWSGIAGGLMLGVRLSYWPLAVSLVELSIIRRSHLAFAAGLVVGIGAWLIPFTAVVGPANLVHLGRVHLTGHFGQWGGTVVTRPDLLPRARALARDVFYDGFAPEPWVAMGLAIVVFVGIMRRKPSPPAPWKPILLALGPYALWVFLAQNILEQPRHVLPLVEGTILLLAVTLAQSWLVIAHAVVLMAVISIPLALSRDRVPPAAVQAADWLAATQPFGDTLVGATRSERFFRACADRDPRGPPFLVREAPWLSGLIGEFARMDRLPSALWVTSEVDLHSGQGAQSPLPAQWAIDPGPTFCRDPRIDRFQPCITLNRLSWKP